jgi:orotate phosphoribosyltransferase
MKMVGAFIADELAHTGINQRQNIAVISPEMTNDKMLMRDNFLPFIEGRHVLLLTASATTGLTVESAVDGVRYYGGTPVGVACVFGGRFDCSVPVAKIFGVEDIDEYSSYSPQDCPMCKANQKVDAVINSYGYSKII